MAQTPIRIAVHANEKVGPPIPPTLFGSFLEPIGNSTYNGLWAEILQNPSFESGLWSANAVRDLTLADPGLARGSQLGLPMPWEPLDVAEGNRYEPKRGDAANSFESLLLLGLPGRETGIRQEIYLPVHRELNYRGSLFVKHVSGEDVVRISLRKRNRPDRTLAGTEFSAGSKDWHKYSFELSLRADDVKPLEPIDFVITVSGGERTLIDQANLVPTDAVDGLDPEMVQLAKDMATPLVRFGGNFTSGYHWRDGIGPLDKRVSMRNLAWGIPETNQFGTDEFLRFCELIGAQPQIALNLGTGSPQEAAEWVRYVNQRWPLHGGLLWELGNELWGDWNTGYPTIGEVAARTLQFSRAIHDVDQKASLIATGQDPDKYEKWNAEQLKNPPETFDLLSTHFVVRTDRLVTKQPSPDTVASATFAMPIEIERKLREMQHQMDAAGRDKAHIAFTEWLFISDRSTDAPNYDNLGGAVTAGGFLNMLLRTSDIVKVADMTGIIEFAGIWKKHGRVFAAPSYYAFQMFSTAKPKTLLKVDTSAATYDVHDGVSRLPEISNVPYLDVVATRDTDDHTISLFCINRNLHEDLETDIAIEGAHLGGVAEVEELYGPSLYAKNDELRPAAIRTEKSQLKVTGAHLRLTLRHSSVSRVDLHLP
jgi:alpha-N-arabinofuranosidase